MYRFYPLGESSTLRYLRTVRGQMSLGWDPELNSRCSPLRSYELNVYGLLVAQNDSLYSKEAGITSA